MPLQTFVIVACVSGLFATVMLDLWQRLVHAVAGIPPANWAFVGRWFAYIPRGRLVHRPIADTPPIEGELALGWTLHYLIGLAYGFAYVGLMVYGLDRQPSLLNGFVFGLCSVMIPWFILQPGLGLGVMGWRTPKPWVPMFNALANHIVYGVALYAGVWLAPAA
ncbi:DUF2938 family protein [Pelagibius sp. 7325]|uniref:DUF2938 family protein n=1 Tax=Pelagibius sp. 7325 TaxID=3131994 RepID=UPI0030EB4C52